MAEVGHRVPRSRPEAEVQFEPSKGAVSVSHRETSSGSHLNVAFLSPGSQRADITWLWFAGEAGFSVQGSTEPVSPHWEWRGGVMGSQSCGGLPKVRSPVIRTQRLCCDRSQGWPTGILFKTSPDDTNAQTTLGRTGLAGPGRGLWRPRTTLGGGLVMEASPVTS